MHTSPIRVEVPSLGTVPEKPSAEFFGERDAPGTQISRVIGSEATCDVDRCSISHSSLPPSLSPFKDALKGGQKEIAEHFRDFTSIDRVKWSVDGS